MLLPRQLLTSKQLHCCLGGSSALGDSAVSLHVLPGAYRTLWGTNSFQENVAVINFMWMGYKFTDSGIFSSCTLLLLPFYFSLKDALCCWQEWLWLLSNPVLFNFASWKLLPSQRHPPLSLWSHPVLFSSLMISVFFYFVTPCLKLYLNYMVIFAWFCFVLVWFGFFFFFNFLLLRIAFCSGFWSSWQKTFSLWAFHAGIRLKNWWSTSLP